MRKQVILIGCLFLCSLLSCKSVVTKDDLVFRSREIKGSISQEPGQDVVPERLSALDQETLIYKAKFLGLSIGTFILTNHGKMLVNGKDAYRFELQVKVMPFFSLLFKTKDRYVSYMDAQSLVVLRHEEYIKGGALLESAVDFNYKDLTAVYQNFITRQEHVVKIPGQLLDVLSGGFYLRMLPLELGDMVDLNIYADQKIYNFTGVLSSKATVSLAHHGTQAAYRFEPYLFLDGQQIKKISGDVFFSITKPAKVLRATLKTILGGVNVVLIEGPELPDTAV